MGDDAEFKRPPKPKATRYEEGSSSSRQRLKPRKEEETDTEQYKNKPTKSIKRTSLGYDEFPGRRVVTTDEAHERNLKPAKGHETQDGDDRHGRYPSPVDEEAGAGERLFCRLPFPKEDSSEGFETIQTLPTEEVSDTDTPEEETVTAIRPEPNREGSKYSPRIHQRHKLEERGQQGEGDRASFGSYSQRTSRTGEDDHGRRVSRRSVVRFHRPDVIDEPVNKSPIHPRSPIAVSKKRSPRKHQRFELLEKDTEKAEASGEFNRRHRRSKSVEDFNPHVKRQRQRRASADFTDTLDECESLKEEVYYGEGHPSYRRSKGSGDSKRSPGQERKLMSTFDEDSSICSIQSPLAEFEDHTVKRKRKLGGDYEDHSSGLQQRRSSPIRHQKRKQLEQRIPLKERRSSQNTSKPARKHVERSLVGRQPKTSFITSILADLHEDIQEVPQFEDITSSAWGCSSRPVEKRRPDKIYVQGRRGFTSRSLSNDPWQRTWAVSRPSSIPFYQKFRLPAEFAVFIQLHSRKLYTVCHGLLAGFGFAHCVLVMSVGVKERDIALVSEVYCYMARMVKTWYYFLGVICLVSVLDRADFARVNRMDFMDCQCYRVYDTILLLIYFFVLFLSNISGVWEEKLSARTRIKHTLPVSFQISRDEFISWQKVSVFRGLLAIVGWVMIAVSDDKEMLLYHLRKMLTYRKKKKKDVTTIF
ncbi:uncharacterized protein [Anabrus simplex]|uniref:uncharacterized protein isoform X2 n=1 Tax=Anabrus simplex TaxID=316456 RepID=UPI0035A38EA3